VNKWQPVDTAPMYEDVWVAFHGHGLNQVIVARRVKQTGHWGDWDYINSHDGEPQWWMPLEKPEPPDGMEGSSCGCDGCTEYYHDPESRGYVGDSESVASPPKSE
jgi:hypothetical protein